MSKFSFWLNEPREEDYSEKDFGKAKAKHHVMKVYANFIDLTGMTDTEVVNETGISSARTWVGENTFAKPTLETLIQLFKLDLPSSQYPEGHGRTLNYVRLFENDDFTKYERQLMDQRKDLMDIVEAYKARINDLEKQVEELKKVTTV